MRKIPSLAAVLGLAAGLAIGLGTAAPVLAQTQVGDTVVFERAPTKAEIDAVFGTGPRTGRGRDTGKLTRSLRGTGTPEATRGIAFHAGARRAAVETPGRPRPRHPDPVLPPLSGNALNIVIQFEFDSASLLLSEGGKLAGLVEWLAENRDRALLIAGHADATGARRYNFGLSARRARSVRDFLVSRQGIEPERLATAGYGETAPLPGRVPTDPINRRVEFRLID